MFPTNIKVYQGGRSMSRGTRWKKTFDLIKPQLISLMSDYVAAIVRVCMYVKRLLKQTLEMDQTGLYTETRVL